MAGTNLRTEPKHIVFLSQLLLLFKFCHVCKTENPEVEAKQVGTEAVVTTNCSNPKCPKQENIWHSQPTMPNSQIPAGNFLLCMSILLAGSSATKVFQFFKHMGLCCVSLNTYFKYQRSQLFPTILVYWKKYQAKLLAKVKGIREGITVAGDGRHDSMGHSAKFGAYTMFCCTIPMIIHFVLIQRNQAESSPAMEFMGFKECMNFLLGYGIVITSFISDRHVSIASHMRKVLTGITHYFDIWHLKKMPQPSPSITKNSSRPNKRTHTNEASPSSRPRKKPRTSASSPTPRTEKGPRTSRPGKRAQGSKPSTSRRQGKKSRTSKS